MSFYFKLYWRVIPYGMLLIDRIASEGNSAGAFILWLVAMSVSFFKSEGFATKRSVYVGLAFSVVEWLCLMVFLEFSGLWALLTCAILVGELIWFGPRGDKVYGLMAVVLLGVLFRGAILEQYEVSTALSFGLGMGLVFWLAWSLRDLEMRKHRAQMYYDQLRESEIALKKAHGELEAYYDTLEEVVVLRERNRISRDIHDTVGHALATTLIQLQAIAHRVGLREESEDEATLLTTLSDFVRDALTRTRQVVRDMVPKLLSYEQFRCDLAELCQKTQGLTQMQVILTMPESDLQLSEDQHACLYTIVKEGLTNAAKHGRATQVKVIIIASDMGVQLVLSDNGRGVAVVVPSFGLEGMQARLAVHGGTLELSSGVGEGFRLKAILPRRIL